MLSAKTEHLKGLVDRRYQSVGLSAGGSISTGRQTVHSIGTSRVSNCTLLIAC